MIERRTDLTVATFGIGRWPGNKELALAFLADLRLVGDEVAYFGVGDEDGAVEAVREAGGHAWAFDWYPIPHFYCQQMIEAVETLPPTNVLYLDLWERPSRGLAEEMPRLVASASPYRLIPRLWYQADGEFMGVCGAALRMWRRGSVWHTGRFGAGIEPRDRAEWDLAATAWHPIIGYQPTDHAHLAQYPRVRFAKCVHDMRARRTDLANIRHLQGVYPQVFTPDVVRWIVDVPYADEALLVPGTPEHERMLRIVLADPDPDDAVPEDWRDIVEQVKGGAFAFDYPRPPEGWTPWPAALEHLIYRGALREGGSA
jgi:hypothetical protein